MIRHDWQLALNPNQAYAACRGCGQSRRGVAATGRIDLSSDCQPVKQAHTWQITIAHGRALAGCTACGRLLDVPASDDVNRLAPLDLSGDCPEAV